VWRWALISDNYQQPYDQQYPPPRRSSYTSSTSAAQSHPHQHIEDDQYTTQPRDEYSRSIHHHHQQPYHPHGEGIERRHDYDRTAVEYGQSPSIHQQHRQHSHPNEYPTASQPSMHHRGVSASASASAHPHPTDTSSHTHTHTHTHSHIHPSPSHSLTSSSNNTTAAVQSTMSSNDKDLTQSLPSLNVKPSLYKDLSEIDKKLYDIWYDRMRYNNKLLIQKQSISKAQFITRLDDAEQHYLDSDIQNLTMLQMNNHTDYMMTLLNQ